MSSMFIMKVVMRDCFVDSVPSMKDPDGVRKKRAGYENGKKIVLFLVETRTAFVLYISASIPDQA